MNAPQMKFAVWAPKATRLWLQLQGTRTPMLADAGGWWHSTEPWRADENYGYVIDDPGSAALPDPRSLRQPKGVHELSRSVDLTAFSWSDVGWRGRDLQGGVIYELHVGTFTPEGTLEAAIDRLDYLVHLGIDFVELLPVNAFNGSTGWGYDGVLWYAVHEAYGGPSGYQHFVDECHVRGLSVIQDVVYNHLGPSGNYLPEFGDYLDRSNSTSWGSAVNLAEPAVREFIIENALMWLREFHVDGLRLDAVHALVDPTETHILRELSERVDALAIELHRTLSLIAESDLNDPVMIRPRSQGGYGLTAQWDDDYHHAVHVNVTGETDGYYRDFNSLAALAKVTTEAFFHDGTYSSFRGKNHGLPVDTDAVPTWRFVTFAQDHDQIGNRAKGDRLSGTLGYDSLAIAAVLGLTSPFTPMLFMGEEWGASTPWQFFTSHPESELGEATREGRMSEFAALGWNPDEVPNPQDPATCEASRLNWNEAGYGDHARLLALYVELIRLRRVTPGLTDARFAASACEWNEVRRWFRLDRPGVSVVVNFAVTDQPVPCPAATEILLQTLPVTLGAENILMPARSAAVVALG
jgi:maltooligosyltrehalose trehalohydrolase